MGGGDYLYKFALYFGVLASFLIILSVFINFYYFQTYHTKIDIFIFGLKDDDTMAILEILWADYPVLWVLFWSVIFGIFCFKITKIILLGRVAESSLDSAKNTGFALDSATRKIVCIFAESTLLLAIIAVDIIGIRGGVGTFPLREDEHHIDANPLINHIATNPILAFAWAYSHYERRDIFAKIDAKQLSQMQSEIFPIFKRNSQNLNAKNPHIVMVLMESFGSNMLLLDDKNSFDLLMSFRAHFEAGKYKKAHKKIGQSDFTFMNFLSEQNGTAGSFAQLFFLSPNANISLSSAKDKKLSCTPFAIYEKAGYEVIYITSGNRAWQNLGDYITTLGAHKIIDANTLIAKYPQSKASQNAYGVNDEYAYKMAFEILQNATKPTFISILTTTNHPPISLPAHFAPPKYNLVPKMHFFNESDENKVRAIVSAFSYSANAFGDFVAQIKGSALKEQTIIAMSGDHKHRDLRARENIALNHATPLYLYVPRAYAKGLEFAPEALGSHKDIFPTLYALSLSECEFLTLGGENLFDKRIKNRFALNSAVWIDEDGIYARGAKSGYFYKNSVGQKVLFATSGEKIEFEMPTNKIEFFNKYDALNKAQLDFRVNE